MKFENYTRFISLLVSFLNQKFVQSVLRMVANFWFRTLARDEPCRHASGKRFMLNQIAQDQPRLVDRLLGDRVAWGEILR